ncbi:hypothetical protein F503_02257 [Ophiostoma piceae UAMH 11346]|uniref:Uncharacterized protein n=1 Tax=Ophiostoma piceae (strain UAMH 11346) TaxID=1262450 RepID=S3CGT3_OPHP1|nr:hypothetical protein F503_02257 [Ophiostoma piceae UAMH 11346]
MNGASTADDAPPSGASQDPSSPPAAADAANGGSGGSGSIKKRKKDALKPIITTEGRRHRAPGQSQYQQEAQGKGRKDAWTLDRIGTGPEWLISHRKS